MCPGAVWLIEGGGAGGERAAHPQTADDFDAKGLSAETMVKRGRESYDAENYVVAMRWFKMAADLGNADGMLGLSWIYGNGRGVPEDDAEALRWRKMSAEHGNAVAMSIMGDDYAKTFGFRDEKVVPQDYAEAMRWYKQAADLGNDGAMFDIGALYADGNGVPQDYTEAMRWYKKSAELGNGIAMYMIGISYVYGHGVTKDEAQARVWLKKAARWVTWQPTCG